MCPMKGGAGKPLAAQPGQTIITIGPSEQDVAQGAGGVIYPVTLTNTGSSSNNSLF